MIWQMNGQRECRGWPRYAPMILWILCVLSFAFPLQAANVVTSPLDRAKIYPNPWRADKNRDALVRFANLPAASTVKLFTVSGHKVRTLTADSDGSAGWDRTNDSGSSVASGIYLYVITDPAGHETSGKLAIIK
jgi:hypothetical protein